MNNNSGYLQYDKIARTGQFGVPAFLLQLLKLGFRDSDCQAARQDPDDLDFMIEPRTSEKKKCLSFLGLSHKKTLYMKTKNYYLSLLKQLYRKQQVGLCASEVPRLPIN